MTDTGKKLMKRLREIYDNHDFVCGAMSNAGNDEAWSKMLDYINYSDELGNTVTTDDILALSLALGAESDTKGNWQKQGNVEVAVAL